MFPSLRYCVLSAYLPVAYLRADRGWKYRIRLDWGESWRYRRGLLAVQWGILADAVQWGILADAVQWGILAERSF